LRDYFNTNFTMINNFSWSLEDIENMKCWERDIYIQLIAEYQEKKKQSSMNSHNGINYFNL
jgi:hypothetical protein